MLAKPRVYKSWFVAASTTRTRAVMPSRSRFFPNGSAITADGKTHTMTIAGKNRVELEDVLIGEVWLCSGQSNMAMTVNRSNDFAKEEPAATFPKIRMFTVDRSPNREPQAECKGTWEVCSPQTVAPRSRSRLAARR